MIPFACMQAPAPAELSISLDTFQEWPHDLQATTQLALHPSTDDFLWGLFKRGQADAVTWAQQQGFPAEVLQKAAALLAQPSAERGLAECDGRGASQQNLLDLRVPPDLAAVKPIVHHHQHPLAADLQHQLRQDANSSSSSCSYSVGHSF